MTQCPQLKHSLIQINLPAALERETIADALEIARNCRDIKECLEASKELAEMQEIDLHNVADRVESTSIQVQDANRHLIHAASAQRNTRTATLSIILGICGMITLGPLGGLIGGTAGLIGGLSSGAVVGAVHYSVTEH